MKQDLRINIYFSAVQGPHTPEGPGWYLLVNRPTVAGLAQSNEEIIPHVRLKPGEVAKIAKVLDKLSEGKPLNWTTGAGRANISVEQAVNEANEEAREAVARTLEEAKILITQMELLKARVEEFETEK
jgi:flavin-binding protein dodecin